MISGVQYCELQGAYLVEVDDPNEQVMNNARKPIILFLKKT